MHDHGLAAPHPVDHGPPAVEGMTGLVVGVGWPDDRHGEAALPVGGSQQVLTGDLVAGILPERVGERGRLGDGESRDRLLVGGRRADKDVLADPPGEDVEVKLHLPRLLRRELRDNVEPAVADGHSQRRAVLGVGRDPAYALGKRAQLRLAAVEHGDIETLYCGLADARRADPPGSADE